MINSEKVQTNINKADLDFNKLRKNFTEVLGGFGIKKIEDIPAGSHRQSDKSHNDVWIIK